jgi:NADH:ubiquinone oxidoreductase subunit F (NADH-binding)
MTLPRLLAGLEEIGGVSHSAHASIHGGLPPTPRIRGSSPPLLDELRRSGLRGRGGGGFPTATKLAAVLGARGRPIVLVNGCEGEPASLKDRLLLERLPHLVIDGALSCARALDADRIVFAVDARQANAGWAIRTALTERDDIGRRGLDAELAAIPSGYISGQETALVNFINSGRALPTMVPPMVFERGLARRPTLASNTETFAHIGLIARYGADWFREAGTEDEPGSALVTLSGGVVEPGVLEIELGASLESLLEAGGGLLGPVRAFLFGGYGGAWVGASAAAGLEISDRSLRAAGATVGPGVIVALPSSACPVSETARIAAWLETQGARQCGPCVNGLAAISATLDAIVDGTADSDALARLGRWAGLVTRRGACAHPDGAARFVTSALDVFADEFADHAAYGRCQACSRPPVLPLPGRVAVAA